MMQGVNPAIIFVVCISVVLQIQVTLFQTPDYLGLRVNLADFFLPFVGLFVMVTLLLRRSVFPVFSSRIVLILIVLMVAAMSVALYQGTVSSWALYNKYCGFLILLSYFLLGAWLVSNQGLGDNLLRYFLQGFCAFMVFVLALSSVSMFLPGAAGWLGEYAWEGFMANRNAFMVTVVFAMIVMGVYQLKGLSLLPLWAHSLFWTLIPVFALYNASRTGWIIGAVILVALNLIRPLMAAKTILPWCLLGGILAYASISVVNNIEVVQGRQMAHFKDVLLDKDTKYYGDQKRLIAVEDGLELYAQSNPVFGAGLGAYRPFQEAKRGEFIDVMDFTALWLLVETGAFGLTVFAAFFGFCLWQLYRTGFARDGPPSPAHQALFFFLIAFAAMTVLHELTYTRFLWFVLGMGLAMPLAKRS